jgi:hypothetical protein
MKQAIRPTPARAARRRRRPEAAAAPIAPAGPAEADRIASPALDHPTARAARQGALAGLQHARGNAFVGRQVRRAGNARPAAVHETHPSPHPIGRKLPAVDAKRTLTPETKALVERYWKRRREDPAWTAEFHKLVDRLFWKETSYKVGKPLNPKLPADQPFCEIWLQTRDKLMAEFKGDPIGDTLVLLRYGESLLERNTAENIDSGKLKAHYMEDCATDPKSDELLKSWKMDPKVYVVLIHPDTKEQMIIQLNAIGFRSGGAIFVKRSQSIQSVRSTLVHETNHALEPDSISKAEAASFERYKDEFQAYWVDPDYAGVTDPDKRAAEIKAHILADYPQLKASYDADEDFKKKVDGHTRPSGNLINSARWAAIEQAVETAPVDAKVIVDNITAMSAEERAFVRADPNFSAMLGRGLGGAALKSAQDALSK